jgi:hypothetical protein
MIFPNEGEIQFDDQAVREEVNQEVNQDANQ